jgi:hypothetical protein
VQAATSILKKVVMSDGHTHLIQHTELPSLVMMVMMHNRIKKKMYVSCYSISQKHAEGDNSDE